MPGTFRTLWYRSAVLILLVAPAAGPVGAQANTPLLDRTLVTARPRPFAAMSRTILAGKEKLTATPSRDSVVQVARSQLGLRYRLGAVAPGMAFDCSGLVKWVMGLFEIEMPRTAALQARTGIELPKDPARLLPGDLLYFGKGKRVTHIGIYVGDGRYVHAANRRTGIVESELPTSSSTWWHGARRVIATPMDDLDALFERVAPVTVATSPVLRLK
ncbi:MAG: C40 family peptidase [Gemmatimonadota bacterium]|nr:C40 family peptidase [Gemmatimonadota bacterium]